MIRRTIGHAALSALALLCASPAFAEAVGKVSELSGADARRKGQDGTVQTLALGSEVQVNDVLEVGAGTRLKITLADESVIALDENSRLTIDEATFSSQNKSFSARLGFGRFWAKVKKFVAGSDSKFEVKTDRAVAGVRGTIFRVDANSMAQRAKPQKQYVWVREGKVGVSAQIEKVATAAAAPAQGQKGERKQVEGPKEISKEAWERKFAELQQGMAVEIGEGHFAVMPKSEPQDEFSKFVGR